MVSTKLTTTVGRQIATDLKDLPPLRKGFVRVVHRTDPENIDSIVEQGLKARTSLYYTSDVYGESDFWEMLPNDPRGDLFGTAKIIMDIPMKEYNILTRNFIGRFYNEKELAEDTYDAYKTNKLVCPSKYIVGAIDQKFPWSKKCIELFRQIARKNPEVEVQKTDLRMFNGKRKVFESPYSAKHNAAKDVSPEEERAIEAEFEALFSEDSKPTESVDCDDLFDNWDFN